MRKMLLDISKKIDPLSLGILKKVKEIADIQEINFFLVGATVRDMILNYIYGVDIYRKTNDIDFAVRLKNWKEYGRLILEIEKVGFVKDERILHRYHFKGMIIDFIPFGEISDKDDIIKWPGKDGKEMNVIGFDDAFRNTEDILIQKTPPVIIRTSSVVGLVLLKIFAWNDRAAEVRTKDAQDLFVIISTYLRAGNETRLFDDHPDIQDEDNYDYELAGARLLGRDIKTMVSASVQQSLIRIFSEKNIYRLAEEMSRYESLNFNQDLKITKCKEFLVALIKGLKE